MRLLTIALIVIGSVAALSLTLEETKTEDISSREFYVCSANNEMVVAYGGKDFTETLVYLDSAKTKEPIKCEVASKNDARMIDGAWLPLTRNGGCPTLKWAENHDGLWCMS